MSADEAAPTQRDDLPVKKTITLQDCKTHNNEGDCWLVISGRVYDVTEFLDEHPGGFDILLAETGIVPISYEICNCLLSGLEACHTSNHMEL